MDLVQAFAAARVKDQEKMVTAHLGNRIFGLISKDSNSEIRKARLLGVLNKIEADPIVKALSPVKQQWVLGCIQSAKELISMNDDEEDEE